MRDEESDSELIGVDVAFVPLGPRTYEEKKNGV
jgi:hypothetical protein